MLVITLAALMLAGQVGIKAASAGSPVYSLELFDDQGEPLVDPIGFNGKVKAVAKVENDPSIVQVEFKWFACGDLTFSSTVPLVGEIAEDIQDVFFAPECPAGGDEGFPWMVEADFGNGHTVQREQSFFVLPESPIGAIAMTVSSVGALGAYLYVRSRKASAVPE